MGIDIVAEPDAWITEWRRTLEADDAFAEAGAGWGVDFEGAVVFSVEADDALDESVHFYVDPYDGAVREARPVEDPGTVEYGFRLAGPYSAWKDLVGGEVGMMDVVLGGPFSFEGETTTLMRYTRAAKLMTDAAAAVDTEFPH